MKDLITMLRTPKLCFLSKGGGKLRLISFLKGEINSTKS